MRRNFLVVWVRKKGTEGELEVNAADAFPRNGLWISLE